MNTSAMIRWPRPLLLPFVACRFRSRAFEQTKFSPRKFERFFSFRLVLEVFTGAHGKHHSASLSIESNDDAIHGWITMRKHEPRGYDTTGGTSNTSKGFTLFIRNNNAFCLFFLPLSVACSLTHSLTSLHTLVLQPVEISNFRI